MLEKIDKLYSETMQVLIVRSDNILWRLNEVVAVDTSLLSCFYQISMNYACIVLGLNLIRIYHGHIYWMDSAYRLFNFGWYSIVVEGNHGNDLTLCGTRKLQFFYAEILPEFKNRAMPKRVNAVCMKIIKGKKPYKISGIYFSSSEFRVSVSLKILFDSYQQNVTLIREHCKRRTHCVTKS